MGRTFLILFLSSAFLTAACAAQGQLDPAFQKIPFEQWLGEPGQAGFRWTASVSHPELSFQQRLTCRIELRVDGRDLQNRRAHGKLLMFLQITDRDGTRYQDDGGVEFNKLDENVKAADLDYSDPAFFLPGEYRLAAAILDTATGEHSARQSQFHVPSPRHDFLTDAWRDLPPVEFIGKEKATDQVYLPGIRGRLQWAAAVHSPVRLNVVLNVALTVAPSVPAPRSRSTAAADLAALIPTLKVMSQTGSSSVSEQVETLDLARRRAVFHQKDVHELDWPALKTSLAEADTASIDVRSLSDRHHGAQFFVSEVRRVLRASEPPCALVVLTRPVAFEPGEDLQPISLEGLPACPVVYIRYRAPAQFVRPLGHEMGGRGFSSHMGGRMGGGAGESPMSRNPAAQDIDELAATLKPLSPKVFDVQTPEQMTKALADVEKLLVGR